MFGRPWLFDAIVGCGLGPEDIPICGIEQVAVLVSNPTQVKLAGCYQRRGVTREVGLEPRQPRVPVAFRGSGLQGALKLAPTVGRHMFLYQDHSSRRMGCPQTHPHLWKGLRSPPGHLSACHRERSSRQNRPRKWITLTRARQASIDSRSRVRQERENQRCGRVGPALSTENAQVARGFSSVCHDDGGARPRQVGFLFFSRAVRNLRGPASSAQGGKCPRAIDALT